MAANMLKVACATVAWAAVAGLLGTQLTGCGRGDGSVAPPGKATPVAAGLNAGNQAAASGQASAQAVDAQPGKRGLGAPHKAGDGPAWQALTPAQQQALQPLAAEWNQMDGV